MRTETFSTLRRAILGVFLLGYGGCSSSAEEKKAAYQTIERTLGNVCSFTRNFNFELSQNLLFCGQEVCVDNDGYYLPNPSEECTNNKGWGTRDGWSYIKSAHPRNFRQGGCVDLESVFDKYFSPPKSFCSIFTHNLEQAKVLADAINVYVD